MIVAILITFITLIVAGITITPSVKRHAMSKYQFNPFGWQVIIWMVVAQLFLLIGLVGGAISGYENTIALIIAGTIICVSVFVYLKKNTDAIIALLATFVLIVISIIVGLISFLIADRLTSKY